MKKKLGVLVLTLSTLVISAACASSGASSRPKPPQPDAGENWAKAAPSELPSRPANAAAVSRAAAGPKMIDGKFGPAPA